MSKLSVQDRKDLEKFTRFLVLKAVQVIVQSRLGERIRSKSHASGTDWFNLAIRDVADIQCETKRALSGQMLSSGTCICTEISLKTVEGDTLVLETWRLGLSDEDDPMIRIPCTVYNRMSLLLKSLIAVTRVTPAYKLSCRQGPESYVICYRIYTGEPQYYLLGEGYQEASIGEVGMPTGTVTLSVVYRTKLTITPQKSEKECPIASMLKSDHFLPEATPCQPLAVPLNAFQHDPTTNGEVGTTQKHTQPVAIQPQEETLNGFLDLPEHRRVGAFAMAANEESQHLLLPESPLLGLLRSTVITEEETKQPATQVGNDTTCQQLAESEDSACDDFVLVELKPPFADNDGNLGAFFRDCQSAPPLASFSTQPTLEEQVGEISCQLAALETSVQDYDEFVNSLCYTETVK